jgi:putative transposase
MAFVRIWIHAVWGTKSHHPYLTKEIKSKVIFHIKENAKTKEIFIDTINGYNDHLHCLMALNADMSVSKAMQLIKGESAFWINKERITEEKFEWADEYFAVSVSESMLAKVKGYINNQEEHHSKTSFTQEYEKFINSFKF